MSLQSHGDLRGCQSQAAGRMQNDVYRHILIRSANSPQNLFAVVDIDVAGQRDAQKADGLLAVDESYHLSASRLSELGQNAFARRLQVISLGHGNQKQQYE